MGHIFTLGGRGGILVLLGFLFVGVATAQETAPDSSSQPRYQVGFAASSFLTLLDEEDPVHQYQIYGRYRIGEGRHLRTAVRYRQRIQDDPEVEIGLRMGLDHRFYRSGPWRFYGGADLIGGYAREANGDAVYRAGVGPVLGALVYLTPHVSLSVEPRLVALYNRYRPSTLQGETPETVTLGIEGVGLLIVSVHF